MAAHAARPGFDGRLVALVTGHQAEADAGQGVGDPGGAEPRLEVAVQLALRGGLAALVAVGDPYAVRQPGRQALGPGSVEVGDQGGPGRGRCGAEVLLVGVGADLRLPGAAQIGSVAVRPGPCRVVDDVGEADRDVVGRWWFDPVLVSLPLHALLDEELFRQLQRLLRAGRGPVGAGSSGGRCRRPVRAAGDRRRQQAGGQQGQGPAVHRATPWARIGRARCFRVVDGPRRAPV